MALSPEDAGLLKELYYQRDGLLDVVRNLEHDRAGFPLPRKILEDFIQRIHDTHNELDQIEYRLNEALKEPEGIYWADKPPEGTNAEFRVANNLMGRLPLESLKNLRIWLDKVFQLGEEQRLLELAREKEKQISTVKSRANEFSLEAIVARIASGNVSKRLMKELLAIAGIKDDDIDGTPDESVATSPEAGELVQGQLREDIGRPDSLQREESGSLQVLPDGSGT